MSKRLTVNKKSLTVVVSGYRKLKKALRSKKKRREGGKKSVLFSVTYFMDVPLLKIYEVKIKKNGR